jgi:hypothetical protein
MRSVEHLLLVGTQALTSNLITWYTVRQASLQWPADHHNLPILHLFTINTADHFVSYIQFCILVYFLSFSLIPFQSLLFARPIVIPLPLPSLFSFFFHWLYNPLGPWPLLFSFMIIFTDGKTPWTSDQLVARPPPKHRITQTQNKHTHQTSMPWVGFEPTISASERAKTVHALDHSATVTGLFSFTSISLSKYSSEIYLIRFPLRVMILSENNQIKEDMVDRDCSMHGRKFRTKFWW